MKNKNKLIALLLSTAFIMLVLGCSTSSDDSTTTSDGGGDTVTKPVIISTVDDTFVKPSGKTVTIAFNTIVEAATGVNLKDSITVFSDDKEDPDTSNKVEAVVFATSTAAVTSGNQITITVETAFATNNKVKVVIAKDAIMDSSGNKNTAELTSEAFFVANNLADYSLSYGSTALAATAETEITFQTTVNNIPDAASATYTIAAKDGTTDITGITIDRSTIKVAATVAVGTYELVVTAATEAAGYKGSKTAEVTLVVSSADAAALTTTVTYENITATYNTEILKTAAIAPTLSVATETVIYSTASLPAGLQVDSTTGKIYGTPTAATESAEYTITATGYGSYKGTKEGKVTIVAAAAAIPTEASFTYGDITGALNIALAAAVGPKWTNKPSGIDIVYTIEPTTLGGLTLNADNGEISGTPTAEIAETEYTLTATASGNYTGSKTAKFKITITKSTTDAAALSGTLSYTNITGTKGTALTAAVSPTWSVADQTASYAISPTLDGTGLSFSTTTGEISGTPTAVIAGTEYMVTATGTGNFKGEITSAKFTITVESGVVNLNTFDLSYDTAASAVFGTEKTYAVTTTIPAAASATYEVVAKTGSNTTDITGISINAADATITVATTTAAGTYELTVTASTAVDGYVGTQTADVSIIVEPKSIDSYTLSYDTAASAVFGTEKTYAVTTTIPAAASATYEVVAKTGSNTTDITGISINAADATITVATTTAAGTYDLTVTALATAANYTSTKTADATITVDPNSIDGYTLSYDTAEKATYGTEKTYAVTTTIPAAASATYEVVAKTGSATTDITGISIGETDATITVATTTAVGTYDLTVTASTAVDGYTGNKTSDVSIIVDLNSIDGYTLSYDTAASAVFGTEKTYAVTTTIPAAASATYEVVAKTGSATTDITGISINAADATITVATTTAVGTYDLTVTASTAVDGYTGNKTSDVSIIVDLNSIDGYTLSYDTAASAVFGTEKTYAVTTTIPAAASATYEVVAKTGSATTDITGISINAADATITVATTTAAGTYDLTVTASTAADGYTGNKTADPTIIVDPKSIDGYTLSYDTAASAVFGTEKTYNRSASDIPAEGTTYAIALTTGGTEVTGISISADGDTITVASTTAVGTYELTVTATGSGNYTGNKTAALTINIEKADLPDISYVSNKKIASGADGTIALAKGAPSGTGIAYAIAPKSTGTATLELPTIEDSETGVVSITAATTPGTYKVTVTAAASSPSYNAGTKETLVYVTVQPAGTDNDFVFDSVEEGMENFGNEADLNYLDVSEVVSLNAVFYDDINNVRTAFNGDISLWDVSKVTDMSSMFRTTTVFNGDISGWDVSNVIRMDEMFSGADAFNQDISGWNMQKVAILNHMFDDATAFNQDLSAWELKAATNLQNMFSGATAFNNGGSTLDHWGPLMTSLTSSSNISNMFRSTTLVGLIGGVGVPCWTSANYDGEYGTFQPEDC